MEQTTIAVLGASGDMARRLLFPALYALERSGALPDVAILGHALEAWDRETFVQRVRDGIVDAGGAMDEECWRRFEARLAYEQGDLSAASIQRLGKVIGGAAIFYLALPPGMFADAAAALAEGGLNNETTGWRRLVIEKPFGTDLASARELNSLLHQRWKEEQIFRIDHYLGKETVQNLLVFRFANRFLEPVLNSHHVAQVQITAAETVGIEGRYRYYDGIGALRDMVQNHLMQLLTLTAIEPPAVWDSEVLRNHKMEVLKAVRPIPTTDVGRNAARGQYVAGPIDGVSAAAYRDEEGINDASETETFAAVKLFIDNWRWKDVPFYLRSGKRLTRDVTEIAIQFREPPTWLFRETPVQRTEPNWLVFRLRPTESMTLSARAKLPGLELRTREVRLSADYSHGNEVAPPAYAQLLLDVLDGDPATFLRFDEVEWAWEVLEPVLTDWQSGKPELYRAGDDGPRGQVGILEPGHEWRSLAL